MTRRFVFFTVFAVVSLSNTGCCGLFRNFAYRLRYCCDAPGQVVGTPAYSAPSYDAAPMAVQQFGGSPGCTNCSMSHGGGHDVAHAAPPAYAPPAGYAMAPQTMAPPAYAAAPQTMAPPGYAAAPPSYAPGAGAPPSYAASQPNVIAGAPYGPAAVQQPYFGTPGYTANFPGRK